MASPRILLSFPGRIGAPGIGTVVWHQATGLARAGAEVLVVCGSVERPMPGVRVLGELLRLRPGWIAPQALALYDRRVARLVARHEHALDLVHVWPGAAERTSLAARALGIPTFLERPRAHAAFAFDVLARERERIGMQARRASAHGLRAAREQRELAAADLLLCPSDFVASTHAARGEGPERLLRHRYGFDPTQFGPAIERPQRRSLVVAFVGRLEPRKGVHLALDAWRRAGVAERGARLVLCGASEPGYEPVLAPLLDQPGVERIGHMRDPATLMQGASALVLPSLEEGSALVTYEARACGAVLLVSDRTGAVARDGHDSLVHPAGDVGALARHLRRLADERSFRLALRANSLAGRGELTWDAAAHVLLDAYAEGIERVRGAAAVTG